MHDANPTDLFSLNCGRCGKSLKIQLKALRDKHTVECPDCEKKLPASGSGFPAPLSQPERCPTLSQRLVIGPPVTRR
jgi:hypothetical protein